MRGVKVRAAIVAGLSALLVSLALTVVATMLVDRNLRRELDRSLGGSLGPVVETLANRTDPVDGDTFLPTTGLDDSDFAMLYPLDKDGAVIWSTLPGDQVDTIAGQVVTGDIVTVDAARHWRAIAEEFTDIDGDNWQVSFGRDLATVDRQVGSIRRWLLLAAAVSSLLVSAATALGMRLALRPVARLRSAADDIDGEVRGRRLTEPASGDEIGRLAHTMNSMLGRIDRAQAAQRQFVSDASHELRSPLAAIGAQLESGIRSATSAPWTEIADTSLAEVQRMTRLVDGLLTLATINEGVTIRPPQLIDLDDIVLQVVASQRRRRPTVDFELAGVSGAVASADNDHVHQIVTNLVANAITHAHSRIRLTVTESSGVAVLTVDDDGPGIPAERHADVFDRFSRLDAARERGVGGAGLGLAIARTLAEAHNGRLSIIGGSLGGACLQLELPSPSTA